MAIISTENELFVFDTGAGYTGQNYITADNANQLIGLTPDAISAIESVSALTGYGYGDMQSNKLEYNTSGYITGYDGSAFAGQGTIPEPIKYTYGTKAYVTFVPNDLQYNNKIEIRQWKEDGDYGRGVVLGETFVSHEQKMGRVVLGIKGGSYASWEAAGKPNLMDVSDLQSRVTTLENGESALQARITTLESLVNTLSGALSAQWTLSAGSGITISNNASKKTTTISIT